MIDTDMPPVDVWWDGDSLIVVVGRVTIEISEAGGRELHDQLGDALSDPDGWTR